jgi:hypothetical protein
MVAPLAAIVSFYFRKRRKLSRRTKILRSNRPNYETPYARKIIISYTIFSNFGQTGKKKKGKTQ